MRARSRSGPREKGKWEKLPKTKAKKHAKTHKHDGKRKKAGDVATPDCCTKDKQISWNVSQLERSPDGQSTNFSFGELIAGNGSRGRYAALQVIVECWTRANVVNVCSRQV